MAGPSELPQLVTEFVDMSKEYLRQETLDPAKRLGRFTGFTIGASLMFAFGGILLAIAGMRGIIYLLPEGPNWEALGYILAALAIGLIIGLVLAMAQREWGPPEPPPTLGELEKSLLTQEK
jgi:hypothetical protein